MPELTDGLGSCDPRAFLVGDARSSGEGCEGRLLLVPEIPDLSGCDLDDISNQQSAAKNQNNVYLGGFQRVEFP